MESLFDGWVQEGMVIRLDIFHWMHRFYVAIRTDTHPKHAIFKSALSGAVFSFNKSDMDALLSAVRKGYSDNLEHLSDVEVIEHHVNRSQLAHHVRRVTLGADVPAGGRSDH